MTASQTKSGHLAALFTILIWGTTFISTKVLLTDFQPVEILFLRFILGYLALWIAHPHFHHLHDRKQELYFAAAGLCGVTLYYLLENIALTFTLASNAGVMVSISPFFAAIFHWLFQKGKRPDRRFLSGFFIAMIGICLISFSSADELSIHPLGDLLALAAAVVWAAYATLSRKISSFGYKTLPATRRTFFYGLLFMLFALPFTGFHVPMQDLLSLKNLGNLLFLGLGASAVCFVSWNFAVRILGAVRTSIYIYMVPVITTVTSAIVLKEQITWPAALGIAFTLAGLFLSESRSHSKEIEI